MAVNTSVNVHGPLPYFSSKFAISSQEKTIKGLQFPLGKRLNSGGVFSRSSTIDTIKNAVNQIINTERGERVMLPRFGCNLKKFLFQPLDEFTYNQIKEEVLFSLNNYLRGATVNKLAVFRIDKIGIEGQHAFKVVLTLKIDQSDLGNFDVEVVIQ